MSARARRHEGCRSRFGGVHAVVDVDLEGRARSARRADRPERRRQDDVHRRHHRVRARTGTDPLGGDDISGLAPHVRARRGLARTWQAIELFDDLTVRENLTVAARQPSIGATRSASCSRDRRRARARRRGARGVRRSTTLADATAERAHAGPAQAGRRGPRAGRAAARCCASTSRPPGSTPRESRSSAATCAASSTAAPRSC